MNICVARARRHQGTIQCKDRAKLDCHIQDLARMVWWPDKYDTGRQRRHSKLKGRWCVRIRLILLTAFLAGCCAKKDRSWRSSDYDPGEQRPPPVSAPGFVACGSVFYYFGGNTPDGRANRLYKYDPIDSPTWLLLDAATAGVQGSPPSPRSRFDITALSGFVYVFGGWTATGHANDFFRYDTRRLTWTELSASSGVTGDPPSPRYFFGITGLGSSVYIFGGMTVTGPSNEIFMFEQAAMRWTKLVASGAVPSPRFSSTFCALGGTLYSFSGRGDISVSASAKLNEFVKVIH